jgi:3-hydroxyisobutyrate dehydrogenase-like beta-hydroxyacid dehydrogenase
MTDNGAVGVVGLGGMGSGIASQLLAAGRRVRVYNRTPTAADPLVAKGAIRADTPADAVEPGGIIITMVANDAALEAVVGGDDGFLEKLGHGGIHISMSTISVALARSLAARHEAHGSDWVAAPVFGRPEAAASGKLWILQSGQAEAKERVRPVLEALSQGLFDIGEAPDAAPVGKIAGNFLIASATEAMGEAFTLLQKSGADARVFHEMMARSIFACPIYANYGRFILDRAFTPPGFKLSLGAKDVGLALGAAAETQTPMPLAGLLRDRFLSAMAQGRGELDWTSIALNAAADAGLKEPVG